MSDISISKADGIWVVRAYGAVIGETADALVLSESGYPDRIYFPRADIAMEFLDPSAQTSACPKKGDAVYFDISSPEGLQKDAAWSYETPHDGLERIASHISFYTEKVTVEQL